MDPTQTLHDMIEAAKQRNKEEYESLIEMQTELKQHLNKYTETNWQAHLRMLKSIETRLISLVGP